MRRVARVSAITWKLKKSIAIEHGTLPPRSVPELYSLCAVYGDVHQKQAHGVMPVVNVASAAWFAGARSDNHRPPVNHIKPFEQKYERDSVYQPPLHLVSVIGSTRAVEKQNSGI